MRPVVVYAFICSMLVCQYECTVKQAAAQMIGSEKKTGCCQHCRSRKPADTICRQLSAPRPAEAPAGESGWCMCKGAVHQGERISLESDFSLALCGWVGICAETPAEIYDAANFVRDESAQTPPLDGRFARIAMRSLQL